jgi:hypothetical protein
MKPENLMDSKLKCVFESGTEAKDSAAVQDMEPPVAVQEAKVTKATKVSSVKASPKVAAKLLKTSLHFNFLYTFF